MGRRSLPSKNLRSWQRAVRIITVLNVSACVAEYSTGLSIWRSFHLHRIWCYGTQIFDTANRVCPSCGLRWSFDFVLLYMLDVSYWHGTGFVMLRNMFVTLAAVSLYVSGVMLTKITRLCRCCCFLCRAHYIMGYCESHVSVESPFHTISLAYALFVCGCVGLGTWIWWVQMTGWLWPGKSDNVKILFYEFMDCELPSHVNSTIVFASSPKLKPCQSAFLLWAGLMIASMSVITFSFVSYFLGKSLQTKNTKKAGAMAKYSNLILIGFAGMWTAGSIAGSSLAMSNMVMTFSFAFLICSVAALLEQLVLKTLMANFSTLNSRKGSQGSWKVTGRKRCCASRFRFICWFWFCRCWTNFAVSTLRHAQISYWTPMTDWPGGEKIGLRWQWKGNCWWLAAGSGQASWKSQFIGIMYFSFSVIVGKITYIVLSELNVLLQAYPLWLVTIVFFLVGLTMFLNPAIPGVPVYLIGGVLLVGSAEVWFGFWLGIAYTCLVCFFIKLTAIAMQQKFFGEKLGTKVWVRQIVGVNSISIRAIKIILEKPGMGIANSAYYAVGQIGLHRF